MSVCKSVVCVCVFFKSMVSVWYRILKPCQLLNLVFLPVPAVSSTCAMNRHTQAHTALQLSHLSANAEGKDMLQIFLFFLF